MPTPAEGSHQPTSPDRVATGNGGRAGPGESLARIGDAR